MLSILLAAVSRAEEEQEEQEQEEDDNTLVTIRIVAPVSGCQSRHQPIPVASI